MSQTWVFPIVVSLLIAGSCTSGSSSSEPAADENPVADSALDTPTTEVVVGAPYDAHLVDGQMTSSSAIELVVAHGACDELEGWSEEGPESVTVGVWARDLTTVSDDPDITYDCGDVGLEDPVDIELAEPLGERRLIVVQRSDSWVGREGFCIEDFDQQGCLEFDLQVGSERIPIFEPTSANPTDIVLGSGSTTSLAIGDLTIGVTTSVAMGEPVFTARSSFWNRDAGIWGGVSVHNRDRSLDFSDPAGRTVDGREAFLVRYLDDDGGFAPQVAIASGPWWIDVSLNTAEPEVQADAMASFLDGLTITEVPGGLPIVSDAQGWIRTGRSELTVLARPYGFFVGLEPSCDPAAEPSCVADVGYVGPTQDPATPIAGDLRSTPELGVETIVPADLDVRIVDFGQLGELVECTGFPAFDPFLLTENAPLYGAASETEVYTGISDWSVRLQPGIETWYVGPAEDPSTVATYIRNADGTWSTESVLTCQ